MNDRRSSILLLLISLALALPQVARASAFEFIPSGARAVGMGGAYTAVADEPNAVYWNPAGLAGIRRPALVYNHLDVQTLGLLSYDQFIYSQPFVYRNAVAASWTRLGTTGQVNWLNYAENTFVFTYQQNVMAGLSLGLNLKVLQIQYSNTAAGFGVDLGARYQVMPELAVAVAAPNLNTPELFWTSGAYERLPRDLRAGVAVYPIPDTLVSLDGHKLLENSPEVRLGAEQVLFERVLSLRAGATYLTAEGRVLASAGLGVRLGFLELAYAYAAHYDLDGNHMLSVNWGF